MDSGFFLGRGEPPKNGVTASFSQNTSWTPAWLVTICTNRYDLPSYQWVKWDGLIHNFAIYVLMHGVGKISIVINAI